MLVLHEQRGDLKLFTGRLRNSPAGFSICQGFGTSSSSVVNSSRPRDQGAYPPETGPYARRERLPSRQPCRAPRLALHALRAYDSTATPPPATPAIGRRPRCSNKPRRPNRACRSTQLAPTVTAKRTRRSSARPTSLRRPSGGGNGPIVRDIDIQYIGPKTVAKSVHPFQHAHLGRQTSPYSSTRPPQMSRKMCAISTRPASSPTSPLRTSRSAMASRSTSSSSPSRW